MPGPADFGEKLLEKTFFSNFRNVNEHAKTGRGDQEGDKSI